MYPRSFLCEEAKIKQRTALKEEICEIGEEAIWESRFTSFLILDEMSIFHPIGGVWVVVVRQMQTVVLGVQISSVRFQKMDRLKRRDIFSRWNTKIA